MTALYYLRRSFAEVFLVLHISLDLSDSLLVPRNLYLLVKIDLLGRLLPMVLQNTALLKIYL